MTARPAGASLEQRLQNLPSDAIAQTVNAYTEAYDAAKSVGLSWPAMHEAGCAAFREALAAVLPQETASRTEPRPTRDEVNVALTFAAPDYLKVEDLRKMADAVGAVRGWREAAPRAPQDAPKEKPE